MNNEQIIIAFTKKGSLLAKKLSTHLKASLRVPRRYLSEAEKQNGFSGLVTEQIQSAFTSFSTLVLIMATGIAVRSIAQVMGNEQSDPAVLVIDEEGRFVISLLPGYMGNANQLALEIAKHLKATPVITTAPEVNELPSLEKLAREYQLTVERPDLLSKFTGAIINDQPVVIWDHWGIDLVWPENVRLVKDDSLKLAPDENMLIIIGHRELEFSNPALSMITLRPKCLTVGIEIFEGVTGPRIIGAIRRYFREHFWSLRSIRTIQAFEQEHSNSGVDEACKELGIPLIILTDDQVPTLVPPAKKRGAPADPVKTLEKSEMAALIGTKNGKLIGTKQILNQISVAVAIDFEGLK
jgi:cobalamin biosynthesis protein CbiG